MHKSGCCVLPVAVGIAYVAAKAGGELRSRGCKAMRKETAARLAGCGPFRRLLAGCLQAAPAPGRGLPASHLHQKETEKLVAVLFT